MSSYSRYLQQKQNAAIKKYSDYEAYIARKNFDHFCCCLEGGTGPTGASGAQGLFGGTSVKYSNPSTEGWNIATTPPTGPSQGIRGNNSDATQITKIYASRNDGDNNDVIDVLKILTTVNNYEKGIIKITKIDDSSRFIMMKVITVVDQTDYIEYEGSIVMATSSTPFINGEAVILTITANGENELRNELTNENAEFFPFMVRNDATVIGPTGATGYTQSGVTINPFDSGLSFTSQINNANKYRTRIVPGAITAQERAILNIFTDSSLTATGPAAATINIGFANSKPFDILTHGSLQASSLLNYYSTVEGSTGALLNLAYQDGILLSTKQQEFTTTATPPDNQQIRLYSNFGNIYLKSTGKGVTGNAVAQGGLFLDSRTVDTTTALSKRENLRQPLYLQAAIDDGPSSQISVDRISGLQMAARTYDTNGTTGGSIQIISQTVNTSRATSGTNSRASDIKRQIQEQNTIIHDAEAGDANALAQAQAEKLRLETIRATYNTSDPEYAELTAKIDYQQTIITRESRVEDTATLNTAIAQLTKLENDLITLPSGAFLAGAKVEPTTEIMGRLAMDNMGNVTLFSGGYTGASGANRLDGTLTIHAAGTSGSMELFNEGVEGLNIKSICNGTRGISIQNSSTGLTAFDQKSEIFLQNNTSYGLEIKTRAVTTQGYGMNLQATKGNIVIQTTGETGIGGGSSLLQAPHIRIATANSASSGGSHLFYMDPYRCKFFAPVGFDVDTSGPTGGIYFSNSASRGINFFNGYTGASGVGEGFQIVSKTPINIGNHNPNNSGRMHFHNDISNKKTIDIDASTSEITIINPNPGGGNSDNLVLSAGTDGGEISSNGTINLLANTVTEIGNSSGHTGLLHIMNGITETIILDGNSTTNQSQSLKLNDGTNSVNALEMYISKGYGNRLSNGPRIESTTETAPFMIRSIGPDDMYITAFHSNSAGATHPNIQITANGKVNVGTSLSSGQINIGVGGAPYQIVCDSNRTSLNEPLKLYQKITSTLNTRLTEEGDIGYDTTVNQIKYRDNKGIVALGNPQLLRSIQGTKSLAKGIFCPGPTGNSESRPGLFQSWNLGTQSAGDVWKIQIGAYPGSSAPPGTPPATNPNYRAVLCCKCRVPPRQGTFNTDLEWSIKVSGHLNIHSLIDDFPNNALMSTNIQIGIIATRANTIAIPQGGTGPDAEDILLARNNLTGGPGTTGPNGGGLGAGGEGGIGTWPRPMHASYYRNLILNSNNEASVEQPIPGGGTYIHQPGSSATGDYYHAVGRMKNGKWIDPMGHGSPIGGGWGRPLQGSGFTATPNTLTGTPINGTKTVSYNILCNNINTSGEYQDLYIWLCVGSNPGPNNQHPEYVEIWRDGMGWFPTDANSNTRPYEGSTQEQNRNQCRPFGNSNMTVEYFHPNLGNYGSDA